MLATRVGVPVLLGACVLAGSACYSPVARDAHGGPGVEFCTSVDADAPAPPAACPDEASIEQYQGRAQETIEGVLGAPMSGVDAVIGKMRIADIDGLTRPFWGHFVTMTGGRMVVHESTFFHPATIACKRPSCASDGSGRLVLRMAGPRSLEIDVGNDGAICNVGRPPGQTTLHFDALDAAVEISFANPAPSMASERTATACVFELSKDGPIEIGSGLLTGTAENCHLAPNDRGEATCTALLHELEFSIVL
jgi:hypothetical protein